MNGKSARKAVHTSKMPQRLGDPSGEGGFGVGRFLHRLRAGKRRLPGTNGGTAALMDMDLFLKEPEAGLAAARTEIGILITNEKGTSVVAASSATPRPLTDAEEEEPQEEAPVSSKEVLHRRDAWLD